MARLLGGEVGVEKTATEIEEKYRKIGDLNRRRSDRFVPTGRSPRPVHKAEGGSARRDAFVEASVRPGYFDRLRMDFLACRPYHGIKSRSAAFAAVFSLVMKVRDFVNPRFLTNADDIYFKTIENLVLSVRQLLNRYSKSPHALLQIPYYEEVLGVIRDWNIEALSEELVRLQLHPRHVLISECRELCKLIYRPIVKLMLLDPNYHIAQALKHIYDVVLAALPKDSPDAAKLKLAYTMGRDMTLRTFIDLRQQLYPLLMKLASVKFRAYSDFFTDQQSQVLAFLSLEASDLIPPKERGQLISQRSAKENQGEIATTPEGAEKAREDEGSEAEAEDEKSENRPERPELPADVTRGLEFLDQLFPQAGFKRVVEFPDFYPYFQPLLKLPRGVELISPEDPLQQVIILVACLQEVLYGFRSIRFNNLGDESAGWLPTAERIEGLTGHWHLFLDEIIGKNYISSLLEYCRQREHGVTTLRGSEYLTKLESELTWIKRRFFIPNITGKIIKGLRPNVSSDLPRLPETLRDMKGVLERIVEDVASGRIQSMENPWEDFTFAVEGYLSKRVRLVLSRRENPEAFLEKRISNVSLVFHTLLIVKTLDWLVSDEKSFYASAYTESGQPVYRADASRDGVPLYNVAVEETFKLIEQSDKRAIESRAEHPSGGENPVDRVTRMETAQSMAHKVRLLMEIPDGEKSFVLLAVTLRKYSEIAAQRGAEKAENWLKKVAVVITSEVRDFEDVPYRVGAGAFIVVMPETAAPDAIHLADRLTKRFKEVEGGELPISMGIVEYQPGWSIEHLLKTAQAAIRDAAKLPSPALVSHEPTTDTFIPHS
jgi:diguanylate cyclase (GGDEF)-like protein